MSPATYSHAQLLGTGSFAEVYLVEQAGKQYAVKCFDKSVLSKRRTFSRAKSGRMVVSTAMDQVAGEVAIMKKLRHPNLVALHEVIDDQDESMMFMVSNTVLRHHSKQNACHPLPTALTEGSRFRRGRRVDVLERIR